LVCAHFCLTVTILKENEQPIPTLFHPVSQRGRQSSGIRGPEPLYWIPTLLLPSTPADPARQTLRLMVTVTVTVTGYLLGNYGQILPTIAV
jgi:hypothetical protein